MTDRFSSAAVRPNFSKSVSGKRTVKNPQIKTLHRIANAFGMTLAEFLDIPELNRFTWKKSSESEPIW